MSVLLLFLVLLSHAHALSSAASSLPLSWPFVLEVLSPNENTNFSLSPAFTPSIATLDAELAPPALSWSPVVRLSLTSATASSLLVGAPSLPSDFPSLLACIDLKLSSVSLVTASGASATSISGGTRLPLSSGVPVLSSSLSGASQLVALLFNFSSTRIRALPGAIARLSAQLDMTVSGGYGSGSSTGSLSTFMSSVSLSGSSSWCSTWFSQSATAWNASFVSQMSNLTALANSQRSAWTSCADAAASDEISPFTSISAVIQRAKRTLRSVTSVASATTKSYTLTASSSGLSVCSQTLPVAVSMCPSGYASIGFFCTLCGNNAITVTVNTSSLPRSSNLVALPSTPTRITQCFTCPDTTEPDSTLSRCKCPTGKLASAQSIVVNSSFVVASTPVCVQCPPGFQCSASDLSITAAALRPGYWRSSATTTTTYTCPFGSSACPGLAPGPSASFRVLPLALSLQLNSSHVVQRFDMVTSFAQSQCATGYESRMCAVCSSTYYSTLISCQSCRVNPLSTSTSGGSIVTAVVWIVIAFVFFWLVSAVMLRSRQPLLRLLQQEAEVEWDKLHTSKAEHEKSMEMMISFLAKMNDDKRAALMRRASMPIDNQPKRSNFHQQFKSNPDVAPSAQSTAAAVAMLGRTNSTNVPAGVLLEYFDRAEHKQREVELVAQDRKAKMQKLLAEREQKRITRIQQSSRGGAPPVDVSDDSDDDAQNPQNPPVELHRAPISPSSTQMARKIAAQRALSSVDDATQLDSARVDALRSMPSNQIQSLVEAAVSVSKENTPRAGASRDENLFESTGNAAEDEVLAQLQALLFARPKAPTAAALSATVAKPSYVRDLNSNGEKLNNDDEDSDLLNRNERGAELVSKDTIMQQEEGDAELMAAFFPLRHLIVFFQMISLFTSPQLTLPPIFLYFLFLVQDVVFGFVGFFSVQCLLGQPPVAFFSILFAALLLLAAVLPGLFVYIDAFRCPNEPSNVVRRAAAINVALLWQNVLFFPAMRALAQLIDCVDVDGSSYLRSDMRIVCWSVSHTSTLVPVLIMMAAWFVCVAIQLLTFLRARKEVSAVKLRAAVGQITDPYHSEWQLFELISALFRGIFPFPLFLLPSSNNAGAQVATVFALFYLCVLLLAAPYKERTYDQLDMLLTAQLLLCCQASSATVVSGSTDSAFYTLYQTIYGITLIGMCCLSVGVGATYVAGNIWWLLSPQTRAMLRATLCARACRATRDSVIGLYDGVVGCFTCSGSDAADTSPSCTESLSNSCLFRLCCAPEPARRRHAYVDEPSAPAEISAATPKASPVFQPVRSPTTPMYSSQRQSSVRVGTASNKTRAKRAQIAPL